MGAQRLHARHGRDQQPRQRDLAKRALDAVQRALQFQSGLFVDGLALGLVGVVGQRQAQIELAGGQQLAAVGDDQRGMLGLAMQQGLGAAFGLDQRAQVAQRGLDDVDRLPGHAGVHRLFDQRSHLSFGGGHRDQLRLGPVAGAFWHGQHVDGGRVDGEVDGVLELPAHGGGPVGARHVGRGVHRHALVLVALQQRHATVALQ